VLALKDTRNYETVEDIEKNKEINIFYL